MPLVGIKPTIPVFKTAKTFRALDRKIIVTSTYSPYFPKTHFNFILPFRTLYHRLCFLQI
jgi:hypothetical protein